MAEQEVVAAELENSGPVPTKQDNAEEHTKPGAAGDPQANANEGETEEEQRRKSGYQRQKEARLRAEAEARYYRELLAQREAPKEEAKAPVEDLKPKKEDFQTLEEYLDARDAWVERRAQKVAEEKYEARVRAEKEAQESEKRQQTWQEQAKAVAAKHEDFEEVISDPTLPITKAMAAVIQKSPVGAELAYYLGTHREEAAEIAKLTDAVDVALALGEIKARLAQEKPKPEVEEEPAPVQTKAPPPPTPVRKTTNVKAPDIHDPNILFKEFKKLREEQVAKRQGK